MYLGTSNVKGSGDLLHLPECGTLYGGMVARGTLYERGTVLVQYSTAWCAHVYSSKYRYCTEFDSDLVLSLSKLSSLLY